MSNLLLDIWNWFLYARLSYWGSHWSANLLLVLAGILIFYKMIQVRRVELRKKVGPFKWLWLAVFLGLDAFFVAYFPGSLHEAIFEPVFVASTLYHNTVTLAQYQYHWANDINIWRSLSIMWATTTILGLGWFFHSRVLRFNWLAWLPFILWLAVWVSLGLEVTLPFPDFHTYPFYCHDCFSTNFAELMYNTTFTIGIVASFNYPLWADVKKAWGLPVVKLARRFAEGSAFGVGTGILTFNLAISWVSLSPNLANLLGYAVGFVGNFGYQYLRGTLREPSPLVKLSRSRTRESSQETRQGPTESS